MYSKTPQSADFGTEQNCTADCEIRRLQVLLYVGNGTKWRITECYTADCGDLLYFLIDKIRERKNKTEHTLHLNEKFLSTKTPRGL